MISKLIRDEGGEAGLQNYQISDTSSHQCRHVAYGFEQVVHMTGLGSIRAV